MMATLTIDFDTIRVKPLEGGNWCTFSTGEVNLTDIQVLDADWVLISYYESVDCDVCDGEGDCQHCGGDWITCDYCFDGECSECDGAGYIQEPVPALWPRAEYEAWLERIREQELLEARYGTPDPDSIRDWWRV